MSFAYIFNVFAAFIISFITIMIVSRYIRIVCYNVHDLFRFKEMRKTADRHRDEYLYHQR